MEFRGINDDCFFPMTPLRYSPCSAQLSNTVDEEEPVTIQWLSVAEFAQECVSECTHLGKHARRIFDQSHHWSVASLISRILCCDAHHARHDCFEITCISWLNTWCHHMSNDLQEGLAMKLFINETDSAVLLLLLAVATFDIGWFLTVADLCLAPHQFVKWCHWRFFVVVILFWWQTYSQGVSWSRRLEWRRWLQEHSG